MKQTDVIREILERLGFPTRRVKRLLPLVEGLNREELQALSIVTSETEVIGIFDGYTIKLIKGGTVRTCALGSLLVEEMKGGE